MTTAFVLSGGGSLGAAQVGMLQSLGARGIQPDLLVGISAGALNALWVADHGMGRDSLDRLAASWVGLRRSDVFPLQPTRLLQGVIGLTRAVCSSDRLANLVRGNTRVDSLEDTTTPVHVLATDLLNGKDVLISSGPASDAILASAAIPGVFSPVWLQDRWLVDGALAATSGVAQAVGLGASEVYVLPGGVPCALPRPPRSAVGVALHSLTLLIAQRLLAEVAEPGRATVRLIPPLCPVTVSATDFSRAGELIRRARRDSDRWLTRGGPALPHPERYLSLHDHRGRGHSGVSKDAGAHSSTSCQESGRSRTA
jgi:NTE family protein